MSRHKAQAAPYAPEALGAYVSLGPTLALPVGTD
jgi:hypothetical protein